MKVLRRGDNDPSAAFRGPLRGAGLVATAVLALAGCNSLDSHSAGGGPARGVGGGGGETVTMARATWDTGWFQAEVYRQLIAELGYAVTDPGEATRDANGFHPALARGEFDLWANGWFPLHDPYREGELDAHPDIRALLEAVMIPLEDIAGQNDQMRRDADCTTADLEAAAEAWIEEHQDDVGGWLDSARNA